MYICILHVYVYYAMILCYDELISIAHTREPFSYFSEMQSSSINLQKHSLTYTVPKYTGRKKVLKCQFRNIAK